ncbi:MULTISPECIES: D-alanine--D-alanine ligase family protein [Staphylococcus]|uniref:D-alanine--D-alanine ligase n=1 Tax=Staphylococcus schleiferi TaxID=1295 RepID=A0A7Z7QP77_STASC|nr:MULTISPECIES: D-alanine--D-alanine ligase [Staphylococcus]QGS45778.1 D-alanine--D-alanine ligase [Mammaliicoccus fleurettii]EPD50759.1 D-alanine-D-alanine ligase [Staphylococcus sp. HGB0015]MBF1993963.1 D-alanine--D-alanine ligase [Staphylococcus schleiferi]MBF2039543.1 D-alanine--D-alanine ligase [Staphylococcus schleiferi]MBF2101521.1 D-alanine--D-alanine ligase [Staphylococcus schleiferi]
MNIIVLAGGLSDERDVSLSSGAQIANALIKNGHKVLMLDLYLGLKEVKNFEEAYNKYGESVYDYEVPEVAPDLEELIDKNNGRKNEIGDNIIDICQTADIVFLGLHGGIGENGKLQAIFDLYNIKYTGTGYKGGLLAMDKIVSKELMTVNHILTPEWRIMNNENINTIKAPAVVKPNDNGSSIGVKVVDDQRELLDAITLSKQYSDTILIEKKIAGREFSVGIIGEKVLPIIELIPKDGFYDYSNKYQPGATEEITPANISDDQTERMQNIALKVFKKLGLEVYGRVDFIMDSNDNIFCIEANSLPGMTPTSLLPQEAEAHGINYEQLCEMIVTHSLEKYR